MPAKADTHLMHIDFDWRLRLKTKATERLPRVERVGGCLRTTS